MKSLDYYAIKEAASLLEAVSLIKRNGKRTIFVVDDDMSIKGLLSEGDILSSIMEEVATHIEVQSIMNTNYYFVSDQDRLDLNSLLMYASKGVLLLPVLNGRSTLVGVVDVIGELIDRINKEG